MPMTPLSHRRFSLSCRSSPDVRVPLRAAVYLGVHTVRVCILPRVVRGLDGALLYDHVPVLRHQPAPWPRAHTTRGSRRACARQRANDVMAPLICLCRDMPDACLRPSFV